MQVFARHSLVDRSGDSSKDELLLEGSWPHGEWRRARWSLDEAIDARFARLDRLAMDLADRAGRVCQQSSSVNVAYINALALRYYLVKLLRVIAFFQEVRPPRIGEKMDLRLAADDEDYACLLQQVARLKGAEVELHWHPSPLVQEEQHRGKAWRRWAARLRRWQPPLTGWAEDCDLARVVLCGNPRILNPICAELVGRGSRVYWLYERFAARSWWRWRAAGVEQLECEPGGRSSPSFNDVSLNSDLIVEGIDLTPSVERWLMKRATEVGRHQSRLVERVASHFRRVRPTALMLDEDATPLKRIAVALARPYRARSAVVQHGAPCGPFGFLPLAADEIAVWGDSSRHQLQTWGLPAERIRVAGWPSLKRPRAMSRAASAARSKRFLLLATMPPRDERPDNVEFHLTSQNHAALFEMALRVLSGIEGATLTIKLHPRDSRTARSWCERLTGRLERQRDKETRGQGEQQIPLSPCLLVPLSSKQRWINKSLRIVQSHDLAALIAASDCVLSCASTAGIEAALAGAPVIQLLPGGSGNVLPAEEWGFIGSARTADELAPLVERALARGWRKDSAAINHVLASRGREAAARVVDGLLGSARSCCNSSRSA